MAPVKPGAYLFRRESITELRQRLGLSQAAMATRIGVPKNTVSRWETGETTPDAQSLAAIYSLGMEVGIVATFFAPVRQKAPVRDAALVYWDMASIHPVSLSAVDTLDASIKQVIEQRVRQAERRLLKAFSHPVHSSMTDRLEALEWRVWEDSVDWTDDIIHHALSDAGQNPSGSVVFIITMDAGYIDLIKNLKSQGVTVYLMALANVNSELIAAVGKRRWIELQ